MDHKVQSQVLNSSRNLITIEENDEQNQNFNTSLNEEVDIQQKNPKKKKFVTFTSMSKEVQNQKIEENGHPEEHLDEHKTPEMIKQEKKVKKLQEKTENMFKMSENLKFQVNCFDYMRLFLPSFFDSSYTKRDLFRKVII